MNNTLDKTFWDKRYLENQIGWDLGEVSPPLKTYIDQLENKNLRILIPGCGNTYEAEYLLSKEFENVTIIDISPTLIKELKQKFKGLKINIIEGDFFEHQGEYDLILEQTFFCALHPSQREDYCSKMYELLSDNGKIVGLLFNLEFEKCGPPFGGSEVEYRNLFSKRFTIQKLEKCYNSYSKRMGTETFAIFLKMHSTK